MRIHHWSHKHTSNEVWKDIPGYEDYYQVSNVGRVKSLERIIEHQLDL